MTSEKYKVARQLTGGETSTTATRLSRFTVLFTRSGVFFGRWGDYMLESSSGHRWIVERTVFYDLYRIVG
jgi:hypothetical protein